MGKRSGYLELPMHDVVSAYAGFRLGASRPNFHRVKPLTSPLYPYAGPESSTHSGNPDNTVAMKVDETLWHIVLHLRFATRKNRGRQAAL